MHILDIAQSSIEAGATRIKLSLIEDLSSDRLIIRISDNGKGMTKAEQRRALDPFRSTRKPRRVSLGLPLLAAMAEACAGSLQIESKRGLGTTITVVLQHSHIDRAPIGDLPRALINIITMLGDGNLIYSHRVITSKGEERFEFNTARIKEELGEVPLDHPGVHKWLSEFIRKGEEKLHQIAQVIR